MPASTKFVPDSEVIVPVQTDAFDGNESRFAVTSLGYGLNDRHDDMFNAYLKLRANVYVDQTGSLSPDARNFDGTETDEDDERSHHFAVVQNLVGRTALVACIRLIHKSEKYVEPLPIEKFYPEHFSAEPAALDSLEVSRFIVRSPESSAQTSIRGKLLTAALSHILVHDLGPTYAVVEQKTNVNLNRTGIATKAFTEATYNETYNEHDMGVEIDTAQTALNFGGDNFVKSAYVEPGMFKQYGQVKREAA